MKIQAVLPVKYPIIKPWSVVKFKSVGLVAEAYSDAFVNSLKTISIRDEAQIQYNSLSTTKATPSYAFEGGGKGYAFVTNKYVQAHILSRLLFNLNSVMKIK